MKVNGLSSPQESNRENSDSVTHLKYFADFNPDAKAFK